MKARTSFLKRCLALALALMMLVSSSNMGIALQAFAAGNSVSHGKLVADNYAALSDAEKALLSSGYLAGGNYEYASLEDGLVQVDTDEKKITAAKSGEWAPTNAYIVVNGEDEETIDISSGECNYTYGGNAFSVRVNYVLNTSVSEDAQNALLNAMGWLKDGVANGDAVSGQGGNLYILEQAMPELVNFANNGVQTPMGSVSFSDACEAAVAELDSQMTANGGKLDLSVTVADYDAAASKIQYVLTKGAGMKEDVVALVANVATINEALTTMVDNLTLFIQNGWVTQDLADQLELLAGVCGNLETGLSGVAAADWTAAEKGTALVSSGVNYSDLDAKVAALGAISTVAVKNPLHVADTSVTVNLNMNDVTVNVVLKVVENNEVTEYATYTETITLSQGVTAAEIKDEVEAAGIVADAVSSWGEAYVDGKFESSASTLPETLTEDITYTITYTPKNYTVTLSYGEEMTVPYGYKYTLPKHSDEAQAYDYTVNGEAMAQGSVYTIVGDTNITRDAGKAYITYNLYSIIANNYGEDIAKAILTSGALKGNETINVREIDSFQASELIALANGELTAVGAHPADYKGKNWVPYTYGANGTEKLFNGNTTVAWGDPSVKVQYRLTLDNFTVAQVTEILETVAAIKAEAAAQKSTLDAFAQNYDTMGQLDKTKLGALNGVIGVTDFTPDDGDENDAKNLELRAYFSETVGNIIAKNLDPDGKLKIYNMLGKYNAEGLTYYYSKADAVINEINSLSGYLDKLLAEEEALKIMVTAAGFPEYAEKITDLGGKMNTVKNSLIAPNAMIDLESAKLGTLMEVLEKAGDATYKTPDHPYLTSTDLSADDPNAGIIKIQVKVTGIEATPFSTDTGDKLQKGDVVTDKVVDELIAAIAGKLKDVKGEDNAKHYEIDYAALKDLVGTELTKTANVELTCSVKQYTVTIDGVGTKTVNIDDRTITLPAHDKTGWSYVYSCPNGEREAYDSAVEYTVPVEHLGNITITRTEKNKVNDDLSDNLGGMTPDKDEDGNITKIHANASADNMMGFAMDLVNMGYSYIELNDRPLVYMNSDTLEICLQTLIDAMLEDNSFGSKTLINLNKNGKGDLFVGKMDLGEEGNPNYLEGIEFIFNMTSVPSQMTTVANGLSKIEKYMTFQSNKGVMNIDLTLPGKIYEAYVTVLLGAGELEKTNINTDEFNDEIAAMFLYDYIDLIMNTDATTTTYTNTLAKLGQSYDLTGAEDYYQMVKKALTGKTDKLNIGINNVEDDGVIDVSVAANGNASIGKLLSLMGMDPAAMANYTSMIKEYKSGDLTINAVADLKNTPHSYDALVLDIDADGVTNKFDYTTNLASKTTAGKAVVILLDDVNGNVNFKGTTVLDLNGNTITGNVTAGGDLYIIDSSLETNSGAGIIGNVSAANVTVLGGMVNVSTLEDGYVKNADGYIHNALFEVVADGSTYTYNVNTDAMESIGTYTDFAKALAVDVAVDMVLNYYTAAALNVDSSDDDVYALNIDQLITLITSEGKVDAVINKVLDCFNATELSNVVNNILADLLAFSDVADALNAEKAVATYTLATSPWKVGVEHITDGDYIDFGLVPNDELTKTQKIAIAFTGDNRIPVAKLCEELGKIAEVEIKVALEQPTYANKDFTVKGSLYETAEFDMSGNTDYAKMIGVILAYGNTAKRAAVAEAINNDDMTALKAVVDNTTVAEVFTALKKLSRTTGFAAMAKAVGVTADVTSAAELEAVYHLSLCAAGKVLEEAGVTGRDSKLGGLYNETTGQYELTKSKLFEKELSKRGYSVFAELNLESIGMTVKLFDQVDCLWGDADHDGDVDPDDATAILQMFVGLPPEDFCELRTDVDCDGDWDPDDATYVLQKFVGLIELPFVPGN